MSSRTIFSVHTQEDSQTSIINNHVQSSEERILNKNKQASNFIIFRFPVELPTIVERRAVSCELWVVEVCVCSYFFCGMKINCSLLLLFATLSDSSSRLIPLQINSRKFLFSLAFLPTFSILDSFCCFFVTADGKKNIILDECKVIAAHKKYKRFVVALLFFQSFNTTSSCSFRNWCYFRDYSHAEARITSFVPSTFLRCRQL